MKLNELMEKYGDYEVKEGFMDLLEKPKPKTVWNLKEGDKYWYVDIFGYVLCDVWSSANNADVLRRDQGNVFLTKTEALFEQKRREVCTIVKKYAYEFSKDEWEDINSDKIYPYYMFSTKEIRYGLNTYQKNNDLYFKSQEDIRKAIDKVGESDFIKYYLGVKDDETGN